MRDPVLEAILQEALDAGHAVWAIGDVHGFDEPLERLLDALELCEGDHVVLLGDLIDRGPHSAEVLARVRTTPNLHAIIGNHELWMVKDYRRDLLMGELPWWGWVSVGGEETLMSYRNLSRTRASSDEGRRAVAHDLIESDLEWIRNLPSHIVLDRWRLVHGGYHPRHPIDEQRPDIHVNIRAECHLHPEPIDPVRTIVFGHTPTGRIEGGRPGHLWASEVLLDDGRPAFIGIDTSLYTCPSDDAHLTALDLSTHRSRRMPRDHQHEHGDA